MLEHARAVSTLEAFLPFPSAGPSAGRLPHNLFLWLIQCQLKGHLGGGDSPAAYSRLLLTLQQHLVLLLINPWYCMSLYCSVAESCPTLCDPLTSARQASLSFTVSQSLLELVSVELVMPSNHLVLCRPLLLLPSIFPSSLPFALGGQNTGASALASVLPMNIQG